MEGYEVVAADGEAVGRVAEVRGSLLVVETGTLRKSRHGLPLRFTRVDEREQVVRTTLGRELIEDSPKLADDVGEAAVEAYYGLPAADVPGVEEGVYAGLNPASTDHGTIAADADLDVHDSERERPTPPPHHLGRRLAR